MLEPDVYNDFISTLMFLVIVVITGLQLLFSNKKASYQSAFEYGFNNMITSIFLLVMYILCKVLVDLTAEILKTFI